MLLDSPRANAVLQTESLDQHAAWSTPSPLGEARLVYRGLSDVPPQGSPSERLDATEGCLWKETRKRGHRPPRCAFWALIPSPLLWRIWLPYFASHHEDDCQPQNDSPAGVLRMYAHEWVLGSPSCSWLWERCDILIYTDVPARGQRARGFRRLLRCEARYHMAQCSWAPA